MSGRADWLTAMLGGALPEFSATLRRPGWQDEVATLGLDQGVRAWPPSWSAEGKDVGSA